MMTLTFLALSVAWPLVVALVALVGAALVARIHVARIEGAYTPDLDSVDAWHASLDVALGLGWFEASPQATPRAVTRRMRAPRKVRRLWPGTVPAHARVIGQPTAREGAHESRIHATLVSAMARTVQETRRGRDPPGAGAPSELGPRLPTARKAPRCSQKCDMSLPGSVAFVVSRAEFFKNFPACRRIVQLRRVYVLGRACPWSRHRLPQ